MPLASPSGQYSNRAYSRYWTTWPSAWGSSGVIGLPKVAAPPPPRHRSRNSWSSDWPVSPVDPLLSIQAAVTRKPFRRGQPEQAQTLGETLASYTRDNAWVEFTEDRKGMLKEGYLADLVLLDGDIEATPKEAIRELKVRATIGDGQVTYEAG